MMAGIMVATSKLYTHEQHLHHRQHSTAHHTTLHYTALHHTTLHAPVLSQRDQLGVVPAVVWLHMTQRADPFGVGREEQHEGSGLQGGRDGGEGSVK